MEVTKEFFKLSFDSLHKVSHSIIKCEDIICINKRQMNRDDINKFSVYYRTTGLKVFSNSIVEIKLKAASRRETDLWIERLRAKIKPKKYQFKIKEKQNPIETVLKEGYKMTPKAFYLKLSCLEYILTKKYMQEFIFNIKYARPEIEISNNLNDSAEEGLFEYGQPEFMNNISKTDSMLDIPDEQIQIIKVDSTDLNTSEVFGYPGPDKNEEVYYMIILILVFTT